MSSKREDPAEGEKKEDEIGYCTKYQRSRSRRRRSKRRQRARYPSEDSAASSTSQPTTDFESDASSDRDSSRGRQKDLDGKQMYKVSVERSEWETDVQG